MTAFLQRYSVGRRLSVAFSVIILLAIVLIAIGLVSMAQARTQLDGIFHDNMTKIKYAAEMLDGNATISVELRNLVLPTDPKENAGFRKAMEDERRKYDEIREKLYALPSDREGRELQRIIDEKREQSRSFNSEVINLASEGKSSEALLVLMSKSAPITAAWQDAIRHYVSMQNERSEKAYARAVASMASGRNLLVGGGVLVVAICVLMAGFITRSLTQPLALATRVAEDISSGKLDHAIDSIARDEPGHLLRCMAAMQSQLKSVLAAQSDMARRHDEGQISYRMDESAFPGDFGAMVRDSNALAASHIAVKLRLVEIMGRYAIGDLSEDMDRLPGEKAVLTETMDTVKRNLTAMNREIGQLASAAAAGDFSVRGDADRFEYDFRGMVDSLNQLMATADGNLGAVSGLLRDVAAGDLSVRISGDFQGVFARMRDDANATASQLAQIVGRIQQAAVTINTAASEIATGNDDLARRTEQQAASLEETAASMEELTSTVKQNAEHARQASELAVGAASVASQGGDAVDRVVATMNGIEASSKRIADIISVIDGIAFQTNILALNAAVEAARAGDHGRGFAVVASEVRVLAQRSAGAAKEIKELIAESVQRVTEGSGLVTKAGETMQEIVTSVQRVTNIMGDISTASQEQYAGIEQVNQTVTQMDEATQQNAALVEEATAAARMMEEQAAELTGAVAVFKVADHRKGRSDVSVISSVEVGQGSRGNKEVDRPHRPLSSKLLQV